MGYYIFAVSRAVATPCPYNDCEGEPTEEDDQNCLANHLTISKNKQGVPPGCYPYLDTDRCYSFEANNSSNHFWYEDLCYFAHGVCYSEWCENYHRYKSKPFAKLLGRGEDVIGPKTASKLYADFVKYFKQAKEYYTSSLGESISYTILREKKIKEQYLGKEREYLMDKVQRHNKENQEWMWERYQDFQEAFRRAKNKGFVMWG